MKQLFLKTFHRSRIGTVLALLYLCLGAYIFLDMAFGSCGGGCFFGRDFEIFLYTLPLSSLIDSSMPLNFLTDRDYTMYLTYATLLLINTGSLYLVGWLISGILRKGRALFHANHV